MEVTDTIRLDTPAGTEELALLKLTKVGDRRHSNLFQAIPTEMAWVCTKVDPLVKWSFTGTFCGVPLLDIDIVLGATALTLLVKESA